MQPSRDSPAVNAVSRFSPLFHLVICGQTSIEIITLKSAFYLKSFQKNKAAIGSLDWYTSPIFFTFLGFWVIPKNCRILINAVKTIPIISSEWLHTMDIIIYVCINSEIYILNINIFGEHSEYLRYAELFGARKIVPDAPWCRSLIQRRATNTWAYHRSVLFSKRSSVNREPISRDHCTSLLQQRSFQSRHEWHRAISHRVP